MQPNEEAIKENMLKKNSIHRWGRNGLACNKPTDYFINEALAAGTVEGAQYCNLEVVGSNVTRKKIDSFYLILKGVQALLARLILSGPGGAG